ncbi:MAG: hypothetical protein U0325_02275 [Polyangiales bacterium]
METDDVRLRVEIPAPAMPTQHTAVWSVGLVAVAATLAAPWRVGVPLALPLLFAVLGFYALRPAPADPYTVEIDATAFAVRSAHYLARTPLEHVRRVVHRPAALVVVIPSGEIPIPLSALAGQPRRLIEALPAHVSYEVDPAPAPPTAQAARKTLALWLLLLVLFGAIYAILGTR